MVKFTVARAEKLVEYLGWVIGGGSALAVWKFGGSLRDVIWVLGIAVTLSTVTVVGAVVAVCYSQRGNKCIPSDEPKSN